MEPFAHLDATGAVRMIDVGDKPITHRVARAAGVVEMSPATLRRIQAGDVAKGDVIAAARVAGIQAAKRTWEMIPLCHSIPLDSVTLSLSYPSDHTIRIEALVQSHARTGVEMEALMAVTCAALTIYDMCKSVDRGMQILYVRLEEKRGGRSGDYRRQPESPTARDASNRPGPMNSDGTPT